VNIALLVARLVLATVFGAAGVAKISGREGTRVTAAAFGVPAGLTGPVTLALPAAELLIAAALVPASSAAIAGWAALALLAVFSATVAISLARGRRPDCYCFGQFTAAPIGWRTLARNVALAAVAAFVALGGWWAGQLDGWPDGGASLGGLGTSRVGTVAAVTALALAVIVDTAVVVLLLGRRGTGPHGRDQASGATAGVAPGPAPATASPAGMAALPVGAAALPVGATAPEFEVAGADGTPMTLTGLRSAGRPVLLIFTDPDCGTCRSLLPDVAAWQAGYRERFTAALISRRPALASAGMTAHPGLAHVGVQRNREVAVAYAYAGTPSAVVVSVDGRIASRVAAGPDGVRALAASLLARAAAGAAAPASAAAGNPA
jgi:thiol-disulfide isomerase/thioredoxin